jgi:hypothetical protein
MSTGVSVGSSAAGGISLELQWQAQVFANEANGDRSVAYR